MAKTLVIAEKPSVAADIAKALGGFKKEKDHFESESMVVTSAVGHLVQLCLPSEMEKKKGKWSFASLPVIPEAFSLKPIEKTEDRYKAVVRLLKRKDIDGVINACDSGREGELIFRYILQLSGIDKPVRRLWLQSMTQNAIREGFQQLRAGAELDALADAAVCRSESDWLVGINATRAMTAFNSKGGGFQLTPVGRVQTPTLAILVDREQKIRNFKPKDYWELHATFEAPAGLYEGRWFDESFKKPETGTDEDNEKKAERLWEASRAEAIRARCEGRPGLVSEEKKPSSQASPLLYDLTSLQRDANKRFGFSAKRTLQLAQALYERHKVLTYPRTDSRALPEDYIGTVKKTMGVLGETALAPFARQALDNNWIHPNKRIFNNAKISDHFAIIPTLQSPAKLDEWEAKLYDMVARRFVAVFFPAAQFEITTRITRVENEPFKSEGKVLVVPGWLAVYGKTAQADPASRDEDENDEKTMIPVGDGATVRTDSVEVRATQTKPPARFNEGTLLSAMEGAGKLVEDEELREAMSERGLGTPATRAATIEGLLLDQYILRDGRDLSATAKGMTLIGILRGIHIPAVCSPEMTGEWEYKLKLMEQKKFSRTEFMEQIAKLTCEVVEKIRASSDLDEIPGEYVTLSSPCPKCGGTIKENHRHYKCQACDFALWKTVAGRTYDPREVEELITHRQIGPLSGFRSKMGRPFSAVLKLDAEFKPKFEFEGGEGGSLDNESFDFSAQESLGKCPVCQGPVFETAMNYVCEKAVGKAKSCTFRSGKTILQQSIERTQMQKLLGSGKTDLLRGFVSSKTKRKFSAFLRVGEGGKVGFEFEPRAPKTKKTPKAKKTASAAETTGA
ncbi:MAG: DNA topoisomerase III [Verrucomicrobiae bacterium]|nr:DNA topoisomerase III [Verrucomicrobiae bacterium]